MVGRHTPGSRWQQAAMQCRMAAGQDQPVSVHIRPSLQVQCVSKASIRHKAALGAVPLG